MIMKPYTITGAKTIEGTCKTSNLDFKDATYIDKKGNEQHWQFVSRTGGKKAVTMACKTADGRFVVIRQPRVPMNGKVVWSFPAGLMDQGETPEATAKREMKEETGYDADIVSTSHPLSKSAGLTDETNIFVECKLGGKGKPELESTENIKTRLMKPSAIIKLGKALKPVEEYMSNDLWTYMSGIVSRSRKKGTS